MISYVAIRDDIRIPESTAEIGKMATYLVTVTVLLITVGGSNALLDSPLNPLLQPTGPYYPPLNLFSTDPELTMTTVRFFYHL